MTILVLIATITLLVAPDTPVGRLLQRHLVVAAVARLARITPGQILLALAVGGVVAFVAWLMQGDGVALLGMAAPEASSWLITFEVSGYLDMLAAVLFAAAPVRVRGVTDGWRVARRPTRRAARARRSRQMARPVAANDDEHRRAAA